MSKLILPKATSAQREAATPVEGDLLYDVDKKALYFGDGAHQGGVAIGIAHDAPYVYGLDYDTSVATASAACKKVVLNHDHDQAGDALRYTVVDNFMAMPAHNFKRCVMDDLATRHVNYYLNASDSTKKEDGTAAVLTGGDGDVMVEIPVAYYRIDKYTDSSDHEHTVWLVSDKPFTGSAIHPFFYVSPDGNTPRTQYVGAFASALCDSDGAALDTNESASASSSFEAGRRARSVAGAKPWTHFVVSEHRTAAQNNNAQTVNALFAQYLALMMAIDGGTFDAQAAFSAGFTNGAYADIFPYEYTRIGGRCNVGNGTGHVIAGDGDSAIAWADGTSDANKVIAFCYRGIENPFGGVSCICDGFVKSNAGYKWTADPGKYGTESAYVEKALAWATGNGYVLSFSDNFFATAFGGSSSTGLTDFVYIGASGAYLAVGGCLFDGAKSGSAKFDVNVTAASRLASAGSRIAC